MSRHGPRDHDKAALRVVPITSRARAAETAAWALNQLLGLQSAAVVSFSVGVGVGWSEAAEVPLSQRPAIVKVAQQDIRRSELGADRIPAVLTTRRHPRAAAVRYAEKQGGRSRAAHVAGEHEAGRARNLLGWKTRASHSAENARASQSDFSPIVFPKSKLLRGILGTPLHRSRALGTQQGSGLRLLCCSLSSSSSGLRVLS